MKASLWTVSPERLQRRSRTPSAVVEGSGAREINPDRIPTLIEQYITIL